MPLNRQLDYKDVVYSQNGILAIKKNEMTPSAATWTDLKNTMFSEISQIEKEKHCMTSLLSEI